MGCLVRCHRALEPGGHLAVLVGDVRRGGAYDSMQSAILRHRGALGELRSILIKVQHACRSDRKADGPLADVPIRHEYCLVFRRAG